MRIFILKVILLGAIISSMIFTISSIPFWRYDFKNGETEANLPIIKSNQHYDIVFLGTSHGRTLSRFGNHDRVEKILSKKIINLSTGGGRGIYSSQIYLDYFFKRGNTTDTIVYFIDPWVFYSNKWNEENDLFKTEPISLSFLNFIVQMGVNGDTISSYIKTKISKSWIKQAPVVETEDLYQLNTIDQNAVTQRIDNLYPDGLDSETFQRYRKDLRDLAELAYDKKIRLILIIPPTLLGDLPGEVELKHAFPELRDNFGLEWHDYSAVIIDPRFYHDHDHLNTIGVVKFSEEYLKPLLVGER